MNDNVKFVIIYKWIKRHTQLYFDIEDEIIEVAGAIEAAEAADLKELEAGNKRSNKQFIFFLTNIAITRVNLFHI